MAEVEERHRKAAQMWAASSDVIVMPREVKAYAQAVAETEARIVEMLKREDAKCDEYLSKGHDQDKRIQQEHYSESMNWTIEAIECGDHDG